MSGRQTAEPADPRNQRNQRIEIEKFHVYPNYEPTKR